MNVDTRYVKAALRHAWWTVQQAKTDPPATLISELMQRSGQQFEAVSGGSIRATSADGQHTTFSEKAEGEVTPVEVLTVWGWLIDLYWIAKAELQGNIPLDYPSGSSVNFRIPTPILNPTDEQIVQQLEYHLRPVTSYTGNFMYLAK